MNRAEAISLYQPLLYSIALKMVDTLEDAEDIVQDTFVKWLSIDTKKIADTKAYLAKSVRNNCLQFLNSLKSKISKKSTCLEEHHELIDGTQEMSSFHLDFEVQMSEAWAVLHKKLEPLEKSIYVLREVFDVEYEELQHIFGKKKDHCRQLFCRAKAKIEKDMSNLKLSKLKLPASFKKACDFGSLSDIITDFKNELVEKFPLRK